MTLRISIIICLLLHFFNTAFGADIDAQIGSLLDKASGSLDSMLLYDMMNSDEYQSNELYVKLTLTCLHSQDRNIASNGIMLYSALADGRKKLGRPIDDIRKVFFDNLPQLTKLSPTLVSGAVTATQNLNESEFFHILAAMNIAKQLHESHQHPLHEPWDGEMIAADAVANLEGNPLDLFLEIYERNPEFKLRVGGSLRTWIYKIEDIRASRIVLAEISDKDIPPPAIFNFMSRIRSNVAREIVHSNGDTSHIAFLDDYAKYLESQANHKNTDIMAEAIGDYLQLGILCPEFSERAITLAADKVDKWKSSSKAERVERLTSESAEFTRLRASSKLSDVDKRALDEKWHRWKEPFRTDWKGRRNAKH